MAILDSTSVFAWQGWKLDLPAGWNPFKLQGDYARGMAAIADMRRIRMVMAWATPGRPFDVDAWISKKLNDKADAARDCSGDKWRGARIWLEPAPPGGDQWLGQSSASGRVVQIECDVEDGSRWIEGVVESITDTARGEGMDWSALDFSCRTQAGWRLAKRQMNAGDLTLEFRKDRDQLCLRQIALAQLALKRNPLSGWLSEQERARTKAYHATSGQRSTSLVADDGRVIEGMRSDVLRRKRLCWSRSISPQLTIMALHDKARDRLLLVESSVVEVAEQVVKTVGWAQENREG